MIHSDFLPKNTVLKGERNFTVKKVNKCYLSIVDEDMNSDAMLILCTLAMM